MIIAPTPPITSQPVTTTSDRDVAGGDGFVFLLGTHQPGWLATAGVPLFISDRRLRAYRTLPRAIAPWACDSGGFTELKQYGQWTVPAAEYVARLRRYRDETGALLWAAPQDWMCEPAVINGGNVNGQHFVGTHLSVAEHQHRTVLNYAHLRELAPDLTILPVVQGDSPDSHRRCADLYWTLLRVDLTALPLVGVGSVCRLQATTTAGRILGALHRHGLHRLHGFGFKTLGLAKHQDRLTSADSLAWSFDARRRARPLPGCPHKNCANCLRYAQSWRQQLLATLRIPTAQGVLFDRSAFGGAA